MISYESFLTKVAKENVGKRLKCLMRKSSQGTTCLWNHYKSTQSQITYQEILQAPQSAEGICSFGCI